MTRIYRHLQTILPLIGCVAIFNSNIAYASDDAIALLYSQADYWDKQQRGDLSRNALNRILLSNSAEYRARYLLGLSYVKENDLTAASLVLRELHASDAAKGYAEKLANEIKSSSFDEKLVANARKLAAEGQHDKAVAIYQKLFDGREPVGAMAIEMYYTMAASDAHRAQALSGLKQLSKKQPNNPQINLALARVLTYTEDTRRQGLELLQQLDAEKSVGESVVEDKRNALLWLHAGPEDINLYEEFLQSHPADSDVKKKYSLLMTSVDPETAEGQVVIGYRYLNKGNTKLSEKAFKQALSQAPKNVDALAGMSIILHRSGQHTLAMKYLQDAEKYDPKSAKKFAELRRGITFWYELEKASDALDKGLADQALSELDQVYATDDAQKLEWLLLRSRAALAKNDLSNAEKWLRQAMQIDSSDERAQMALLDLFLDKRNLSGLASVIAELEKVQASSSPTATVQSDVLKAKILRCKGILAEQNNNYRLAENYYKTGIEKNPEDVWIRLDYVRFLAKTQGDTVANIEVNRIPVTGALRNQGRFARALYFNENQNWNQVVDNLQEIDSDFQTADSQRILKYALFRNNVESIVANGELRGGKSVENDLIQLYETETDIRDRSVYIVDALIKLDLEQTAVAIARQSLRRNRSELTPAVQLALINNLIEWGMTDVAATYLSELEGSANLNAQSIRDVTTARLRLEHYYAQQSIKDKKYSKARDHLASASRLEPSNTTTLRLRGQLAREEGKLSDSIKYYQQAIAIDSQDLWAIKGAVGSAIEFGDLKAARGIVQNALTEFPEEPDIYELISQIAQAANDAELAIEALAYSRQLKRKQ